MKKIVLAAMLAIVLTGFAATAFAGDGYYVQEKILQASEKRIAEAAGKEVGNSQDQFDCCIETNR